MSESASTASGVSPSDASVASNARRRRHRFTGASGLPRAGFGFRIHGVLATAVGLLGIFSSSSLEVEAQDLSLSAKTQVSVLSNVLLFDRTFRERAGEEIVVGILYHSDVRSSARAKDDFLAALSDGTLERTLEMPVRVELLEIRGGGVIPAGLGEGWIDLLYIMPLRAVGIPQITDISRQHGILTVTAVPGYVEEGISLGLGSRNGRPEILVNQEGAAAEGAELSSEILKLARLAGVQ